jgi:hypothetical protein
MSLPRPNRSACAIVTRGCGAIHVALRWRCAQALPVYYLHKAVVATVGVLTRRMPKRSHAVEQARMMLHGSLLTWSFALAVAHLTGFLARAASPTPMHAHPPSLASSQGPHHQHSPASSHHWANLDNVTGANHSTNTAWWVFQGGVANPNPSPGGCDSSQL